MSGKIDITNYEAWLLDYFEGNLNPEQTTELKAFVLVHPELGIDLDDSELLTLDKENLSFDGKEELFKATVINDETLLEYLEGNLGTSDKKLVEAELLKNKNLADDFNLFKKTVLVAGEDTFENKNSLLKTDDDFLLSNSVIAYLENELTAEEKKIFENELQHNRKLSTELAQFKKTRLEADLSVVYPDKEELKKEAKIVSLFSYRNMAAAAAVLVVTGITVVMFNLNHTTGMENGLAVKKVQKNNAGNSETIEYVKSNSNPETFLAEKSSSNTLSKKDHSSQSVAIAIKTSKDSAAVPLNKTPEENIVIQPSANSTPDSASLAANTANTTHKEAVIKYTNENVIALVDDETEQKSEKNGFWRRAVKFAQQVNGLGVKAVKGDEKNDEEYSLSFNSFSVEKK